jgi:hypothetical protein
MSRNQWLRKAELLIGSDQKALDFSQFHFTFHITQADKENYQAAFIRIYNVSDETKKEWKAKEFSRVILSAGYQTGNYGVIFDGEIIQAVAGRESPVDTYIDIVAGEGYQANQAVTNQTIAAGATGLTVAQAMADTMGKSLKPYDYNPDVKLPRGQALYGMSRDVLHYYAAAAGSSYYYDKGFLVWVPLQGHKPGEAVVLNADTGLVGWPQQTQEGVTLRCLLNPLLDVGATMKIDNASIQQAVTSASFTAESDYFNTIPPLDNDGIYRIYRIQHSGDTRGNDWYSDIVGLAVTGDTGVSSLVQRGQF